MNECNDEAINAMTKWKDALSLNPFIALEAVKNGIYIKNNNDISFQPKVALKRWLDTDSYCLYYRPYSRVMLRDYKKTWALAKEDLTEDESEKEIDS